MGAVSATARTRDSGGDAGWRRCDGARASARVTHALARDPTRPTRRDPPQPGPTQRSVIATAAAAPVLEAAVALGAAAAFLAVAALLAALVAAALAGVLSGSALPAAAAAIRLRRRRLLAGVACIGR